jgi:oligopeptide transport system substrate-binding protein
VSELDPHTLRIDLAGPAPYFPSILANAVAYPERAGADRRPGNGEGLVSNGAYRLVKWVPGGDLTLERNPEYWDAANVAVPRIDYVAIADSNAEYARYRAGELDMTSTVPSAQFAQLRRERPGELQVRPQLAVVYYVFNLSRPPFRDAPGLREALSLAIDRQRITDGILAAGQVPAYSFVPPGIQGYEGPDYAWRTESAESRAARARALYAAAGYSATRPLRLRLLCPEDDRLRKVALAVSAMWRAVLGVEATPVYLEYRSFLAAREQRGDWDVLSHGWNADYPDPGNFLGIFNRGSAQNDARFADPEFERRMAAAATEADGAQRLALLASAERRLLDAYAIAPLYYAVSARLVNPRVDGAVLAPMNHNYSKYLSLRSDERKAAR